MLFERRARTLRRFIIGGAKVNGKRPPRSDIVPESSSEPGFSFWST
jgi:hypothetical protein